MILRRLALAGQGNATQRGASIYRIARSLRILPSCLCKNLQIRAAAVPRLKAHARIHADRRTIRRVDRQYESPPACLSGEPLGMLGNFGPPAVAALRRSDTHVDQFDVPKRRMIGQQQATNVAAPHDARSTSGRDRTLRSRDIRPARLRSREHHPTPDNPANVRKWLRSCESGDRGSLGSLGSMTRTPRSPQVDGPGTPPPYTRGRACRPDAGIHGRPAQPRRSGSHAPRVFGQSALHARRATGRQPPGDVRPSTTARSRPPAGATPPRSGRVGLAKGPRQPASGRGRRRSGRRATVRPWRLLPEACRPARAAAPPEMAENQRERFGAILVRDYINVEG